MQYQGSCPPGGYRYRYSSRWSNTWGNSNSLNVHGNLCVEMKAYRLVQQYSWVCMHYWLLLSRLTSRHMWGRIVGNHNNIHTDPGSQYTSNSTTDTDTTTTDTTTVNNSRTPLLFVSNMQLCLQQYTREHTYEYQQYFNLDVYSQLKRRSGTLLWSMQDYYRYGLTHKPLQQILTEDLLGYSIDQLSYKHTHTHPSQAQADKVNIKQKIKQHKQPKHKHKDKDGQDKSTDTQSILGQIVHKQAKCRQYISYNIAYLDSISTSHILRGKLKWLTLSDHINANKHRHAQKQHNKDRSSQADTKSKIIS